MSGAQNTADAGRAGDTPHTATPMRKIVHSCDPSNFNRTRRGIQTLSTLECGHQEYTNATDRKVGKIYCFDCRYGRPPSVNGSITLAALAAAKGGAS